MTAADRMRRWRQRSRDGKTVVQIEIDEGLVENLVEAGFLDPNYSDSKEHITAAIQRVHRALRVTPQPDGMR